MKDDTEDRVAQLILGAEEFEAPAFQDSQPGKPRVRIDKANPDRTVAALRDALNRSPRLFERGGPVRLVDDAIQGLIAVPHTPESIILLAHEVCRPYLVKKTKDGDFEEIDTALPRSIAITYLDWHGERRLPVLNGIASTPLLRDDGSLNSAVGYDLHTGVWLSGAPDIGRLVPETPVRAEAENALRFLRRHFQTFCFADAVTTRVPDIPEPLVDLKQPPQHDESALLVALLTAVCRPSLLLAPGILIRAASVSGAGSGKGLLARCICSVAFGNEPFAVTAGADSAEFDKRIAAELISGGPVLLLDNLNDRAIKSDLLASAITERPTRVRLLGESKMAKLSATTLLILTGNGMNVSEDLARRFIAIELDPRIEDPEARNFTGDIRLEIAQSRPDLLAAALTIWRWGRQMGYSLPKGLPLGSFEQWGRWVRDPLLALGCRDPVQRVSDAKQRDVRRMEFAALFKVWHERHGNRPVAASALHQDVRAALDPQERGRQFVARKLETLTGTRLGGMVLTREKGGHWSPATYALLPSDEPDRHRDHRGGGNDG